MATFHSLTSPVSLGVSFLHVAAANATLCGCSKEGNVPPCRSSCTAPTYGGSLYAAFTCSFSSVFGTEPDRRCRLLCCTRAASICQVFSTRHLYSFPLRVLGSMKKQGFKMGARGACVFWFTIIPSARIVGLAIDVCVQNAFALSIRFLLNCGSQVRV